MCHPCSDLGQDVPPRAPATECRADAICVADCNLWRRTSPSKFIMASDQYKVPEQRFSGTIARNENLEPLLPISSRSSLKGWDDFISNLRLDAAHDWKIESLSSPPVELVTEGRIQEAQQSSSDCQSKVSKQVDSKSVDFSKCTARYNRKANRAVGALSSPHHFAIWSSNARCYGNLTSLTMRGRGVFAMHSICRPSCFGNNTVRGFSAESGNSPSPPLYWQGGSIVMRRPSVDLPPTSLVHSLYQEPSRRFVHDSPYGLLDGEFVNENSFLLHFDLTEYFTRNPVMKRVLIIGDESRTVYWKLREPVKYSFHTFLCTVSAFHDLGVCLSEISENTVAVDSSGRMSFIKGTFFFVLRMKEGIDKNFRDTSQLFQRLTVISMGEDIASCIPNDFSLLLDIMDTLGFEMRYLIITHSSLLPIDSKAAVYMKIYQNVKAKLSKTLIGDLFESVPYGIGWFLAATSNLYLSEHLRRHEMMMKRSRPEFNFKGDKYELFDTGRHLFSHRYGTYGMDGIWVRQVDLMWDMLFGDLTAYLQLGLIKKDIAHAHIFTSILRSIRVEDHFLVRKITRPSWG